MTETVRLRPYQLQAVQAVFDGFKRGVHRQLLVMATGLGKTVVVAAIAAKSGWGPGRRMFGIMHREELIEQAIERLKAQNPGRTVDFEKASHRADAAADIVLASVQTVGRGSGERLARFPAGDFSKLWIDEVHHAPAKSYVNVMKHFGVAENPATPRLLLGTTATPERLDRLGYDTLFDDVVFRYDLRQGIEDGWLADIVCWRVKTAVDLSGVKIRAGEFVEGDLGRTVDVERRNQIFGATYLERSRGRRNLVFCVTKEHARHVAELLKGEGVRAALIIEDTGAEERREAIKAFREGRLEALVNVSVLTEGFDVPEVDGIHLLRPTKSTALLLQMIGRGTRRTPGKDRVNVFDYADDFEGKELATVGRLFGLPAGFDFAGGSVLEQVKRIEALDEEFGGGLPIDESASLADLLAEIERVDPLNLYASVAKEPSKYSDLRWRRSHEDCYVLTWRNPTQGEVKGDKPWLAAARRVVGEKNLWALPERIEVEVNELGKWEVSRLANDKKERLDLHESLKAAVEWADSWVRAERPHVVRLLDMAEAWTVEPASEAQLAALVRKGYPVEKLVDGKGFPVISKGQAALLMEKKVPNFLRKRPN